MHGTDMLKSHIPLSHCLIHASYASHDRHIISFGNKELANIAIANSLVPSMPELKATTL